MEKLSFAEAVTIRLENIGCIIWSPRKHRYFLLSSKYREPFTNCLINGHGIISVYEMIPEIRKELEDIGVNESAQIVNNLNRSKRPIFAPLEYYFDYTNQCNLRCRECYNIDTWGNTCMDTNTIRSIIEEMHSLGVRRTYLAGGEPLINTDALHVYLDTCYKWGITSSIATNGTLLNDELCEYLLSRELFDISVSIDGWDSDSSIRIRGREKFENAVSGVKKLVSHKKKMHSNTEICIKPIISRQLDDQFYENMINLAINLDVDKLKLINPERSLNHSKGYYGIDIDKYYKMNEYIAVLQQKYKGTLNITNGSNPCNGFGNVGIKGMNGCIGGQELIAINPDGRISPCLMDHVVLGNYFDFGSMEEFLKRCEKLESYQQEKDYYNCHACSIYSRCRGGCQVRKIVQSGTRNDVDPLCPVKNNIAITANSHKYSDALDLIICAHSL